MRRLMHRRRATFRERRPWRCMRDVENANDAFVGINVNGLGVATVVARHPMAVGAIDKHSHGHRRFSVGRSVLTHALSQVSTYEASSLRDLQEDRIVQAVETIQKRR